MTIQHIYKVKLNKNQKKELLKITRCGKRSVRELKKAQILLFSSEGKRDREIAGLLHITTRTIQTTRKRFCKEGMGVLKRKPIVGKPRKIDGRVEAEIMAVALSDPPKGRANWTLQLIGDRLVSLNVIDSISQQSISRTLKKKRLSIGSQRNGRYRLKQMGILSTTWKIF